MFILDFTTDVSSFFQYIRDSLNRLLLLFDSLFAILSSFLNRINISTTFLFSFVVLTFGLFVAFSVYEIWRH